MSDVVYLSEEKRMRERREQLTEQFREACRDMGGKYEAGDVPAFGRGESCAIQRNIGEMLLEHHSGDVISGYDHNGISFMIEPDEVHVDKRASEKRTMIISCSEGDHIRISRDELMFYGHMTHEV